MRRHPGRLIRPTRFACMALCVSLTCAAPAAASHTQESLFQDDAYLLYRSTAQVTQTLAVLRSLGVERVRVTVKWSAIAPRAQSRTPPPGFHAADPAAYPSGAWAPYDRVVQLATRQGIGVDFNITAPGPIWAMGRVPPSQVAAHHWEPDPASFGQFVQAVGTRYNGSTQGVPAVHYFSIWNEPNQPGWLAPQWLRMGRRQIPVSPVLYRYYVAEAFSALRASGHRPGPDTILIGELAPEGFDSPGIYRAMTPMPFLRALYCVDAHFRRLRGVSAARLACPQQGGTRAFRIFNPGLFQASGFAHHPYYFYWPPDHGSSDPNFVPLGSLRRLEHGLDKAFAAWGVHRQIPIYLTEYGYQTSPPDPYQLVSPGLQARYLNQADYLAWRDPRVRSVAQFLLRDSSPNPQYPVSDPRYWDTFQTGLEFTSGRPKAAFYAYRLPIWVPDTTLKRGARIEVWGQLRPAPDGTRQRATLLWAPAGRRWRPIQSLSTSSARNYLTTWVRLRASGRLRILWHGMHSRSVAVRVS